MASIIFLAYMAITIPVAMVIAKIIVSFFK
jgi:hypothetical protein